MSLLGIHLTLMLGPSIAVPAPAPVIEALQSVEVTHNDQGRSGFQITFAVGRAGAMDLLDYGLVSNPLLRPMNRVVLVVTFNVVPRVLFDGIITHRQLSPSSQPGASTLTITGEDVSVMMDLEEKIHEHPAQVEPIIVAQLLLPYMQYLALPPVILPPPTLDVPIPLQRTPVFRGTDYAYLQEMARRYGYVFYVSPGPLPLTNKAYWGPPSRVDVPQRALSVNMGSQTNLDSIQFQYQALESTTVQGKAMAFGRAMPVKTFTSLRMPPLASMPPLVAQGKMRSTLLDEPDGVGYVGAFARAQGQTDASMDQVLVGSGELDALRYGDLLRARGVVGLRGAGFAHDGFYFVKSVTHAIRQGEYKQRFSLSREGLGALTPVVPP